MTLLVKMDTKLTTPRTRLARRNREYNLLTEFRWRLSQSSLHHGPMSNVSSVLKFQLDETSAIQSYLVGDRNAGTTRSFAKFCTVPPRLVGSVGGKAVLRPQAIRSSSIIIYIPDPARTSPACNRKVNWICGYARGS